MSSFYLIDTFCTMSALQEYKRNWIHHVNRMPRNRLPRVMKQYFPTGRRNHGRPLTLRLLMSYIYGAPSKARNANVVYIWTYVWQR